MHRPPRSVRLRHLHREIHGEILQLWQFGRCSQDNREDMRTHLVPEILSNISPERDRNFLIVNQSDTVFLQVRLHLLIGFIKLLSLHSHQSAYLLQRLLRIGNIQIFPPVPQGSESLQCGHAHPKELVQIGAVDPKKLDSLVERHIRVSRFLKHPGIERKPTGFFASKFAIHRTSTLRTRSEKCYLNFAKFPSHKSI